MGLIEEDAPVILEIN